jgi:hypothetical protein
MLSPRKAGLRVGGRNSKQIQEIENFEPSHFSHLIIWP